MPPLAAGTHLGPYQIVVPVGIGGMGEVYKAKDPRLGRDVAVKLLPKALAKDPERVRRFEQEARAVGALNHPNILQVFDVGSQAGAPYLVTELLEGDTLRRKISDGPMPIRRAIDLAIQIARGLSAAHAKGIVHRDLKPENLFVTKDGRLKILDFGLAKLTDEQRPPEAAGMESTMEGAETHPGAVMGTAGYMAPEQVRGKPADWRADIFAFGAILFEMLAGRRAFEGETPMDRAVSMLKGSVPDVAALCPAAPPGLDRLVRHCLELDPGDRFQSARDLAFHLEALTSISSLTPGPSLPPAPPPRRSLAPFLAVFALAGVAATAVVLFRGGGPRSPATAAPPAAVQPVAAALPTYAKITFAQGVIRHARIAPDGQTIVYGAAWWDEPFRVYVARRDGSGGVLFAQPGTDILAISPKNEVALLLDIHPAWGPGSFTGTLALAPLGGGGPRPLMNDVGAAAYHPDGRLAVVREVSGQRRLEFPSGRVLYMTDGWLDAIRFSPDGTTIAALEHPWIGDDRGSVALFDSTTGARRTIGPEWPSIQGLAFRPDGREVWLSATPSGVAHELQAVSLEGKHRTLLRAAGSLLIADVTADGRLLVTHDLRRHGIYGSSAGESRERELSWFDFSIVKEISADGHTMLFTECGEIAGPDYDVYVRTVEGGPAVRLGDGYASALSPDGQWVAAIRYSPEPRLYLVPTGAGDARPVDTRGIVPDEVTFLPDRTDELLLTGAAPGGRPRVWRLRPAEPPQPLTPEGVVGILSPDRTELASPVAAGAVDIYRIADGSRRTVKLPRTIPGLEIAGWLGDGRSVFVHGHGVVPLAVFRLDLGTGKLTPWKELSPAARVGVEAITRVRIDLAGKAYAYGYEQVLSTMYLVEHLP